MPNTTPALDEPGVLAQVRAAAAASGSPVELLAHGAVTAGRAARPLAALGELADAGVVGFSRRRRAGPIGGRSCGPRWPTPARSACRSSTTPRTATLTAGAEANDGFVATVLGLRGWPAAAEEAAVARDLAILADVVRDVPGARLHLTHLSTAGVARPRPAREGRRAAGHLRRHAAPPRLHRRVDRRARARWALGRRAAIRGRDGALVAPPFDPSLRVNPPLRSPADAAACPGRAGRRHGRRGRDRPRAAHRGGQGTSSSASRRTGSAASRRRSGVLLAAVDAGRLPLARAIEALTTGPARVLGGRSRRDGTVGLVEGAPADLVVVRPLGGAGP